MHRDCLLGLEQILRNMVKMLDENETEAQNTVDTDENTPQAQLKNSYAQMCCIQMRDCERVCMCAFLRSHSRFLRRLCTALCPGSHI